MMMFALVTAFLYAWGLKKSMTQETDLERILLYKSSGKVIKYLNKNGTINNKQIPMVIKNIRGGMFWSRKKAKINDTDKFTKTLVEFMIAQRFIEYAGNDGYRKVK